MPSLNKIVNIKYKYFSKFAIFGPEILQKRLIFPKRALRIRHQHNASGSLNPKTEKLLSTSTLQGSTFFPLRLYNSIYINTMLQCFPLFCMTSTIVTE
jgi:hypothetical protein